MCKLSTFRLLCILVAVPAFGAESKNLVLHRPYTYWPSPEYYDSHDPENDPIHLTDGNTSYGPSMWMNKSTVGWIAGLDVVDIIAATPTTMSPSGEQSSPTEEIRIESVEITEA